MSLDIIRSDSFTKEFKRLAKRYRGLVEDYENFLVSLEANPLQCTEIAPNIRKIRMAITAKGRGKSGGARHYIQCACFGTGGENIPAAHL